MERIKKLHGILPYLSVEETGGIMSRLESYEGFKIRRTDKGLLMSKASDSFGIEFFLGEILVCEAEVEMKNTAGYGLVIGENIIHAVIIAFADSAFSAGEFSFFADIEPIIKAAAERKKSADEAEKGLISSTRVNFGLMVEG